MKKVIIWTWLMVLTSSIVTAENLPIISSSPTNITVYPGNTAAFAVTANGATSYQWICNGTNIAGATGATLQVTNAQSANCGYYLALAQNSTGWVPSQMAYLTLDYTYGGTQPTECGTLPLSNTNNLYSAGAIGIDGFPIGIPTNGTVQIYAGPELDEMQPMGRVIHYSPTGIYTYTNGYYNGPAQLDHTVSPGQPVYYAVFATFTNGFQPDSGITEPSTIMLLSAGTNGLPAPSCYGLKFPSFDEVQDSSGFPTNIDPEFYPSLVGKTCVPGESCTISNAYFAYSDYGVPTVQWRKNGIPIPGATNNTYTYNNFVSGNGMFTITNVQPSDAGVYDMVVYGNIWAISPKFTLSVQTTNGQGIFQNPMLTGTNLIYNLTGIVGRNYQLQWSTNLTTWNSLVTLTNISGTVAFTNPASPGPQFYRTLLLP